MHWPHFRWIIAVRDPLLLPALLHSEQGWALNGYLMQSK
jgi:hypothetical protein